MTSTGTAGGAARTRHWCVSLLWMTTGLAWFLASFLPWTSRGLMSTSSLQDGSRLIRTGALSSIAPGWLAWLLLGVPLGGLVVFATATRDGGAVTAIRVALLLAVAAVFVALGYALAEVDVTRLGPGAWLTGGGVVLGGLGLAERWRHRLSTREGRQHT